MLRLVTGHALGRFLDRVLSPVAPFSRAVFCSPFIDAGVRRRIVDFAARLGSQRPLLKVLTSPEAAGALNDELPGQKGSPCVRVLAVPGLHAKAYLARGVSGEPSIALVSSANLTHAGCEEQIEVGVFASSTSESGARVIADVGEFLSCLGQKASRMAARSAQRRRRVWKRN